MTGSHLISSLIKAARSNLNEESLVSRVPTLARYVTYGRAKLTSSLREKGTEPVGQFEQNDKSVHTLTHYMISLHSPPVRL